MAGLTRAQRAEREAEKQPDPVAPVDDGLVPMEKAGESMRVHPTCVKAHIAAGWKVKG